ncbi:hypothetical protein HPB50_011600 [Hyalomma asiaticum]|uniref:Uncharacterized protein n=1 Tax=Hyalomma asiaticum TaxID=266040 RepID=A0ACB7T4E6_HYAAI|nr:hypothetical protein HPB50_011600 [Hyalomma asiaticum]
MSTNVLSNSQPPLTEAALLHDECIVLRVMPLYTKAALMVAHACESSKITYAVSLLAANYEDPPLICSMDGHVTSLRYPERLCSHIVFLSAVVVSAQEAKPADGVETSFQKFKNLRRTYGTVKKLLSFDVSEISTISMDVLHNAYLSIPDNWLDGIDIRYIRGNEPSLRLFKTLRALADGQSYIIHGVFDSVKMNVMKDFHIATLRVYKQLTPPGPFKAVSLQPTADVERAIGEYDTAVEGANLAAFGNHCIAFSLAAVQYDGARAYGDNAVDFAKVPYCSDDYERKGSPTTPNGHSHYVRNDKMDSLFVFEAPEHFKNKSERTNPIRKAYKVALTLFRSASTEHLLCLRLRNTLEELLQAHRTAQIHRLQRSRRGRWILNQVGYNVFATRHGPATIAPIIRKRFRKKPLPKKMLANYNGRRKARATSFYRTHASNSEAACVDAAKHPGPIYTCALNVVGKIGRMPKACLMLDDIYFDRHTCTCDDMNFKLLKTARRVLWQTLKG